MEMFSQGGGAVFVEFRAALYFGWRCARFLNPQPGAADLGDTNVAAPGMPRSNLKTIKWTVASWRAETEVSGRRSRIESGPARADLIDRCAMNRWGTAFKYLMFLVFPVWLLDGCLNRDPNLYVDEKYRLIAIAWGEPLTLRVRPLSLEVSKPRMDDVKEFRMGERVLTGQSTNGYFVVDRTSDMRSFYATAADRDASLVSQFGTARGDLKPLPVTAGMRGNFFFPYNLLFYGGAILCIFVYCFVMLPRRDGESGLRQIKMRG